MMNRTTFCRPLLVLALAGILGRSTLAQAGASFEKAIAKDSTSPSYVLVTIINDNTGTRQTICTGANFLLGAIHYQYHIPYTREGEQEGKRVALASKDRTYHFSKADALKNFRVGYTPRILAQVRRRLKNVTTSDLVKGMGYNGKFLAIYEKYQKFSDFVAHRDALAYVLLERGLQPVQGDMSGGVFLSR